MRSKLPRYNSIACATLCILAQFASRTAWAQGTGAVSPPTVLNHVDAIYPTAAAAANKHADVVLFVTVDTDGHVSQVEVVESGGKELDEAAVTAMRQWTFNPARRDGRAVRSRIRVPFHFAPPAPAPEVQPANAADANVQGGVSTERAGVGVSSPSPSEI
jgi:TonB family protein